MSTHSYGLLPWRFAPNDGERRSPAGPQVLLAHMGGPFWARKDAGAWTIPKGLPEGGESPLETARREFGEELGLPAPEGAAVDLGEVQQRGGKVVRAWAVKTDLDPDMIVPGEFSMTWPPRSGRTQSFPEIDRVRWMDPDEARGLIVAAQAELVDRLLEHLDRPATGA